MRAASAAAIQKLLQKLLVENRVILHAPGNRSATLAAHRFFEQITNDIATSTSRIARPARGASKTL
jgi:hypothetical protein